MHQFPLYTKQNFINKSELPSSNVYRQLKQYQAANVLLKTEVCQVEDNNGHCNQKKCKKYVVLNGTWPGAVEQALGRVINERMKRTGKRTQNRL
jgi:hypothetical protein